MTKSGRAKRSKTLFAHAVLASMREEQLAQKHFDRLFCDVDGLRSRFYNKL